MRNTKIEWCDATWNPVTGCYHNCEYCYARRIAMRFGGNDRLSTFTPYQKRWHRANGTDAFYDEASAEKPMLFVVDKPLFLPNKLDKRKTEKFGRQIFENKKAPYPFDFNPTLYKYRLDEPQKWKKPKTIFVCSMADLFGEWVPDAWIEQVLAACERAPQHRYLFLTKNPKRYEQVCSGYTPPNWWFGWTQTENDGTSVKTHHSTKTFISVEPILKRFDSETIEGVEWVIIGAETGNRKGKVVPDYWWVHDLVETCESSGVPVFMKNSLLPIVGEENMRRDFPW